jgi:hypothetical protein
MLLADPSKNLFQQTAKRSKSARTLRAGRGLPDLMRISGSHFPERQLEQHEYREYDGRRRAKNSSVVPRAEES